MSYSDLDVMIDVHDPNTYIDGCKCEPDVNYICELCRTHNTLREAKRMLLLRDTEIERLRDQHDTYAEMVEQLTRQLDAAAVLLLRPGRVEWTYDADREAMAYFLDGEYAGATLLDLIRAAAEKGA